jgi:hypothetical protein
MPASSTMPGAGQAPAAVPVAFWLLPCEADAHWLQDRIDRLAQRHGGPRFDAHITLHVAGCPARTDRTDLEAVMLRLAARSVALRLAALQTGESQAYYKALYVDIAADRMDGARLPALRRQLVEEWLAAIAGREQPEAHGPKPAASFGLEQALAAYEFLPHLSLLYGQLSQPLRQELAAQNDLQGRILVFDRVAAVRPAAGRADLARVEDWDVFGHRRLGG